MRRQLAGGLVAAVAAVAVSAAGAGGARASLSPGPGSQLWAARYNGSGNNGVAYSVAVSPGGRRVFVTGQSAGTGGGVDYATVAYNAVTGARLWAARYHGPANTWDAASSVAVSPTGGMVFVTGVSQGTASGLDYATVAYNAATGARLWVKRYSGPGNADDGATSVVVSPGGGTVFVTGYSQGTAPGFGYATVAYNAATGAQRWAARYHGPGTGDNFAQSLAVSPGGGTVYVTGQSKTTATAADYATVAYNAATGAQMWVARYHGSAPGEDAAHAVTVSPDGKTVYVTGVSKATTSYLVYAYATVAYNAATGAQRWAARYNGPANGDDAATSVAVSPGSGTVYVTGYSTGTSGVTSVYATAAYNAATGAQRWAARYNGPVTGANVAYSLAVSPTTGTVYVTGTSGEAYATVAYHP